jgi:glycerate kinase
MMEVFGLELYDEFDNKLEVLPKNFSKVKKIVVPEFESPFKIELICDVENPLVGKDGASKIFALQKGATTEEVEELDKGFVKILTELEIDKKTIKELHGSGGGLAAAFKIFFDADERFASQFILHDLGIHNNQSNYNLVITGEGKLDSQTIMNKGAMIVVDEFAQKNIPVYFICGLTEGDLPKINNLKVLELAEYFNSQEESIKKIEQGIELACKRIVKDIIQGFTVKNSN